MLTTEMPTWLVFFFLAFTFAVKHVANERIEDLDCIRRTYRVHGLVGLLITVPTINAVVTLGILFPFIGYWALVPAVVEWFLIGVLVLYRVSRLPNRVVSGGLFSELNLMRLVMGVAYLHYVFLATGVLGFGLITA